MLTVCIFVDKLNTVALSKFLSGCSNRHEYVIFSDNYDAIFDFDVYNCSEFFGFINASRSDYFIIMSDDSFLMYIDDLFIDRYKVQDIGVFSAYPYEVNYSSAVAFRPDHYYGCVLLHASTKTFLDKDFCFNRWMGHSAIFASIVNDYNIKIFPIETNILPCLTQMKGINISANRNNCYHLLKYIDGHNDGIGLDLDFLRENKYILNCLYDANVVEVDVMDNHLSSITRWLSSRCPFHGQNKKVSDTISLVGKKVVIFRVEHIGDVLLSYPLIDAILSSGAKSVSIVTTKSTAFAFEDDERIDKLIIVNNEFRDVINRQNVYELLDESLVALSDELAGIDVAIFPQYAADITFYKHISLLLCIPYTVGIRNRIESEGMYYNLLYEYMLTNCYDIHANDYHEFERICSLAEHIELSLNIESVKKLVKKKVLVKNLPNDYIVISLGASCPNRRWPVERYQMVFSKILSRYPSMHFVILGGNDVYESSLCLASLTNCINLCGKLSLRETIDVLSKAQLFCGNDSGLMHLASIVGNPIVEISMHPISGEPYHINSPKRFGPYFSPAVILQPPEPIEDKCKGFCMGRISHCIEQIQHDIVSESISHMLVRIYRNE